MRLRLGRPRAALVLAPHPDDEAIGAAALIAALRRRGTAVRVVIVTDGTASHPGSGTWPATRLAAERRRESRRAMRRLGLPAGALTFLGLPDGAITGDMARCSHAVWREIARRRGLDLIVGPAVGDEHPDHRAVAAAALRARGIRRLAYHVWPARGRRSGRAGTLTERRGAAAMRSLLGLYRTQLGLIRDDPAGFVIARHELDAFCRPVSRFAELRG